MSNYERKHTSERPNEYFWRKHPTRNGHYEWRTRTNIPVEPILPIIETALKMNAGSDEQFFDRIGVDRMRVWRWFNGQYKTAHIDLIDKICLELGYSLTAIYDTEEDDD